MQYPNFKIILFDFPNKTKMDFYIRMTQQKKQATNRYYNLLLVFSPQKRGVFAIYLLYTNHST